MQDFISSLNSEQREVVLAGSGPCLVLAGAGSGKTRTITARVAHLLSEGVSPERILLVTFTNKAAREMQERIVSFTDGKRLPWAGTFHSVGYRLLRTYGAVLGYSSNTTVMDSDDAQALMKLCIKSISGSGKKYPSAQVLLSAVSFAKNAGSDLRDVISDKYSQFEYIADELLAMRDMYEKKKQENAVWDFDDLLLKTVGMLHSQKDIANHLAAQFEHILVDEYQDTNLLQAQMLDVLAGTHKNILAVGDDAQSIYSFRAAHIENILGFEKRYDGARVFRLTKNYRSSPDILSLANDVISHNVHQYEKKLESVQSAFAKPVLTVCADQKEEAEKIADRIEMLFGEGVERKEVAVLFRSSHHSQALEMELTRRGVSYEYRGGMRFFERAHVKDALAFLRVIANPSDILSLQRIFLLEEGIGPSGAESLSEAVRSAALSAPDGKLSEECFVSAIDGARLRAKTGAAQVARIFSHLLSAEQHPSVLLFSLLETRYSEYIQNEYPDGRERLKDIEQLAALSENAKDLPSFLSEASLQEGFERGDKAIKEEDRIILSTIHQAKGLEWDSVFVIHLSQGEFPSERSLRERRGVEEERRLLYVALTRAKKRLCLSYALANGFGMFGGPSMFLEEIDGRLLEAAEDTSVTSFLGEHDGLSYVPEDDAWGIKRTSFLKSIDEL